MYLNAVRIPWFADFDAPEKYGLARELLIEPLKNNTLKHFPCSEQDLEFQNQDGG